METPANGNGALFDKGFARSFSPIRSGGMGSQKMASGGDRGWLFARRSIPRSGGRSVLRRE